MKNLIVDISGALSVIFAVLAGVPYIFSILSGKTKPHQMTWLVFSIMNGIVFFSQYLKGARASVLISLVFFVFTIIDFLLSLRYGVRNTSRWDGLLLGFSLLTIVIWALTKNPSIAIWLTVLIDIFASSMMILKIRGTPNSEAILPWTMGSIAYFFSILTLVNKPFGILYVRPVYGILSDVAVIAAVYWFSKGDFRKRLRTKGGNQTTPVAQ